MLKIYETDSTHCSDAPPDLQHSAVELDTGPQKRRPNLPGQLFRFAVVGGLNTVVDLLLLNGLLWFFPTTSSPMLLLYNMLAYSLGALNSFFLNKYWTFGQKQVTTRGELLRFTLTTLGGIGWSTGILWLISNTLHPLLGNPTVWANVSKGFAIVGTALISYLGMRLWVFVHHKPEQTRRYLS